MVLVCPQCSARLQLDESKAPSRPFSVRCPKCQTSVSHDPTNSAESPITSAEVSVDAGSESAPRFATPTAAPRFVPRDAETPVSVEEPVSGLSEIAKLLAAALGQSPRPEGTPGKRPRWDRRKALVCSSPAYREAIAESLVNNEYEVYIASNMAEALGRMREERMDVIVLDANFDPVEQGVAFVTREVRLLRPSERRRLFVVYVTTGVRTMDLHAAFLQNVNLVVNPSDIEQIPDVLEVSIRHYNELYRPFNRSLDVAPI